MECIEARALKSSFLSQMAMKTNSQVFYNDDVWCVTGINNVVTEDFPVEDLLNLDFPEKEFQDGCLFGEDDEEKVSLNRSSNNSSSTFEFDNLSAGELAVPVDDLENLEWLSQFVDDSTSSGHSFLCPAGSFSKETGGALGNRVEPVSRPVQKNRVPVFPFPVLRKPRTKRLRSNGRTWSLVTPPLSTAESSSVSSSSSTLSPFVLTNAVHDVDWFSSADKPPAKKPKRKPETESGLVSGRRCTHCQVNKTPQWRTGPLGPKTLCNACGVRFKSGRLYPEYRPACSPTFSQEMHSNSHRKVLEMRRMKEVITVVEPGLARAVQSF
ncbi:hypothetical protein RD792_016355 [Penstemon davidsonii]|uniref:GATA transcription factor n=1 Tax=Penstemon davidsonii TaxID=160366 RepID=A0ABR0CLQ1_9LAMI|nr:hypothetical protein RD792_016355 [Penstemon davidsonii]